MITILNRPALNLFFAMIRLDSLNASGDSAAPWREKIPIAPIALGRYSTPAQACHADGLLAARSRFRSYRMFRCSLTCLVPLLLALTPLGAQPGDNPKTPPTIVVRLGSL